jgi:hypothetical protein
VTLNRTNRRQNIMELAACSPQTGKCRTVVREEWPASWVENTPTMQYLADNKRFIWASERSEAQMKRLTGFSMRVPTINVSVVDLSFVAAKATSNAEIDAAIEEAANGALKGIIGINRKPLVSVDFNHDPRSSIYDATLTQVMGGTLVKVCSWYDNEWGFSNRMLDVTRALVAAK